MRRFVLLALAATGVIFCCVKISVAADGPVKAPMIKPAYNWTGFYIGGNAGYGWGGRTNPDMSATENPPGMIGIVTYLTLPGGNVFPNLSPDGFIGGGQIGFNWQSPGSRWVLGIEADFQGADIKDGATALARPALGFPFNETLSLDLNWFGTVRGRTGYAFGASGNWLAYATGGLAYGHVKSSVDWTRVSPSALTIFSASASETLVGWTAGAGLEYAFGNWSFGAEYLYYDLGDTSVTANSLVTGASGTLTAVQEVNGHIVRAKLNFRLGQDSVIAKY